MSLSLLPYVGLLMYIKFLVGLNNFPISATTVLWIASFCMYVYVLRVVRPSILRSFILRSSILRSFILRSSFYGLRSTFF
jgi:hypothetical protein